MGAFRATLLVGVIFSTSADAIDYKRWLDQPDEMKRATLAVMINTLNYVSLLDKERQLYCPPGALRLQPEQVQSIMADYIKVRPMWSDRPDFPLELLFVTALIDTFPCGQ